MKLSPYFTNRPGLVVALSFIGVLNKAMKIRINIAVVRRQLENLKARCKVTPSGCWEWPGVRTSYGYGQKWAFRKQQYTHRLALKFAGRLISGLQALHRCDNPPCCNPAHLRSGTQKDNITDCVSKGRARKSTGEAHYRAKLTAAQVVQIRIRAGEGTVRLAQEFGVNHPAIWSILTRRTWRHI